MKEKNTWHEHFTAYIRDLDKKKPVIWMGDLNVAPTAIGAPFTLSVIFCSMPYIFTQTWQIRSQIGTRHRDTPKMKRKRLKIS
jgi:exonuclease III